MAAVAGLRGTGNFVDGERPKDYRELILWRNPNGSAPLFALTSKARKRTVNDPEYIWWDEPNDIIRLQVNGAVTSSGTVLTVDSLDPTEAAANRVWGTARHLKMGDQLLVEPAADNATYDFEVVEVVDVISDTQFTVKRAQQGTSAATISDNVYLLLIGSAFPEGSGAPKATSRNPLKFYNYTQIFKDTYELTGTANATKLRTGEAWSNDKKRKVFDHSRNIELAMLLGRRSEITGENGKPKRTMNGLRAQIPSSRTTVFGAAVTPTSFLDAVYPVFDFDSPAGDERVAFCGNSALNILNKAILNHSSTRITYSEQIKTVYGMNFKQYNLPQGTLYLRTHPLMNRHPMLQNSMFVLDFSSITYVELKGRGTKMNDDVQSKDEDVRRGFIQSECSVELDRGGLTCAYLGGFQ